MTEYKFFVAGKYRRNKSRSASLTVNASNEHDAIRKANEKHSWFAATEATRISDEL